MTRRFQVTLWARDTERTYTWRVDGDEHSTPLDAARYAYECHQETDREPVLLPTIGDVKEVTA